MLFFNMKSSFPLGIDNSGWTAWSIRIDAKNNSITAASQKAVTCARYGTPLQKWPRSAIFLRFVPKNRTGSSSEVEDDAGDGLEVVLVLAEEGVEHIIAFRPQGQPLIQPEVHAPARLHHERGPAGVRRLRLQVPATEQRVPPGLPTRPPRANPYAPAAPKILHMLTVVDLRRKARYQVAFHGKPIVREVRHRRV